jgi:hypothetical protein
MTRSNSTVGEWQRARLLPTVGIRGAKEQEQRATSALLAVMAGVPSFGRELVADLGAPRGHIDAYTEVPLRTDDDAKVYPNGALLAQRGKKSWSALVEVKTGKSPTTLAAPTTCRSRCPRTSCGPSACGSCPGGGS